MRKPRGLTLLETVVTIGVFAILFGVATMLLIGGVNAWRQGQQKNELRAAGRNAVDMLLQDMRQATSISSPSPSASNTGQALVFQRPGPNDVGTFTITYTIENNALIRSDGSNKVVIAENVVGTDPRTTPSGSSFFGWYRENKTTQTAGYAGWTLKVSLYMVTNASTIATTDRTKRQDISLTTSIFQMTQVVGEPSTYPAAANSTNGTTYPAASLSSVPAPTDLSDPRPLPFQGEI
ncbi:MAG: type II secretion system protein [Armatimonadetes bacterium]|nr:type II secretion system protein [Armatimonadota bacterium]